MFPPIRRAEDQLYIFYGGERRYWVSQVVFRGSGGQFQILGQLGPCRIVGTTRAISVGV